MAGYIGPSPPNRILSSADIADNSITGAKIVAGTIEASDVASDMATQAEIDLKANIASPTFTGTIGGADHLKVLTEVDQWRVHTNFSSDATPLTANWERVDTQFDKVGTGMTESSGVFTFPSTGIWWVLFEVYGAKDSGASVRLNAYIEGAQDKAGSYSTLAQGKVSTSSAGFGQMQAQCIFDCTSIHGTNGSAVRMNVEAAGASTFEGDSAITATSVTFLKLGDT